MRSMLSQSPTNVSIRIPLATLYTVGFVDSAGGRVPGTSKGRSANQRSRSAIMVVQQDELSRVFCRKAWARHCTTDELCDEIFRTYADFHPATIGIDATANQQLFADSLIREAREKGKKLQLTKVALGSDKDVRIETTLQPLASAGKFFIDPDLPGYSDLRQEWEAFPGSQFKDMLDALAGAIKLLPTRHTNDELKHEIDAYRQHLRTLPHVTEEMIEREIFKAFGNGVN